MRYGLLFDSLYAVDYGQMTIRYSDERTMIVPHQGKEYRVRDYVAAGGSGISRPTPAAITIRTILLRSSRPSRTGGSAAAPTTATGPGRSGARAGPLSGARPRLHGTLARLLAAEHARP